MQTFARVRATTRLGHGSEKPRNGDETAKWGRTTFDRGEYPLVDADALLRLKFPRS